MGAINGNIAADGTFAAAVVFSPQGRGLKQDARSPLSREKDLPFFG
jgi:hypothetical protein